MATDWYTFYGAFDNSTSELGNIIIGGSPDAIGPFQVDLGTAHAEGRGYGIRFHHDGNYNVQFEFNCIDFGISDTEQVFDTNYLIYAGSPGQWAYDFVMEVYTTSSPSQDSWTHLTDQGNIFQHVSAEPLYPHEGWQDTASHNVTISNVVTLPQDTTFVKVCVKGALATLPFENIFPIEVIIPDIRPWAIRKSGVFRSFNTLPGYFYIRKSGQWNDISVMKENEVGQANTGHSRIRKSGTWVGQSKVGT